MTVKNEASTGTLNIISIVASGDFSVPTATNTCARAVGARRHLHHGRALHSHWAGTRTGSLTVTDNSARGSNSVILTGTGVLALEHSLACQPDLLTTGDQCAQRRQNVTVKNTDATQTLLVNTPTITGDYQVSSNGCTSPLLPATSCIIQIVFDPTASGVRTGILTITGNGSTMPAMIALTGTAGATSTLSPATLTFAATNEGQNISLPVTLTNQSNFAFNVLSIAISGAAASDFSQSNNCGTSVSASPAFCTITVTFAPTATGNRNATLTVTTDAAASPQAVALLGIGTAPAVSLSVPAAGHQLHLPESTAEYSIVRLVRADQVEQHGHRAAEHYRRRHHHHRHQCRRLQPDQHLRQPGCGRSQLHHQRGVYALGAQQPQRNPEYYRQRRTGPADRWRCWVRASLVKTPTITPASQSLTFTNQPLNQASAAQTVTVTNTDPTYPLTVSAPVITGNFQVVALSNGNNCAT